MEAETKTCQNCSQKFTIEPEDFGFYEKIKVPPPTFCWRCRLQRRLAFRNERSLYKGTCTICGKSVLSMYSPDKPFKVSCKECWYSDKWDPLEYGRDYDFSKPFFQQFRELSEQVPRINILAYGSSKNCDYANYYINGKNLYLSFSISEGEDVYYSRSIDDSKDIFDCYNLKNSEQCYENSDGSRNYRSQYLIRSRDCIDSTFLFDCVNCQNCFMSSNLRNGQYVIRNVQYTKENYEKEIAKHNLGKYSELENLYKEFLTLIKKSLHKYANAIKITDSTGDNIENSKNCHFIFDGYDTKDIKFGVRFFGTEDSYDVYGSVRGELLYEVVAIGPDAHNVQFSMNSPTSRESNYIDWCINGSYQFGCVGAQKKQYCILNKQYTKEEYEALVPKIREHMNTHPYTDKGGRVYKFGEFFPAEISPFAYNETITQEHFPVTKDEAGEESYSWRDPDPYPHQPTKQSADLTDDIKDAQDSILNEVIACDGCGHAYRILKPELEFLRHQNIALPRKCENCRYKDRFALRNPLKLWHRKCMCDYKVRENTVSHGHHLEGRCPNEFETSYAPDRPETVYCEACYNAEVV